MNRIYAAENLPPPFPQGELAFIKDLKKHVVFTHHRNDAAQQIPDTVAILNGFDVSFRFSDEEKRLETALFDLERFFKEAGIPTGKGTQIVIQKSDDTDLKGEDFRITVTKDLITLESNTKEGIRRSIYRFMDRIAELCTPYLAFGTETKKYWLKNRISRCFFGPIKRPPFNIVRTGINLHGSFGRIFEPSGKRRGERLVAYHHFQRYLQNLFPSSKPRCRPPYSQTACHCGKMPPLRDQNLGILY